MESIVIKAERRRFEVNEYIPSEFKAKNKFPNNRVTTTKYTCATFIPKNLLE